MNTSVVASNTSTALEEWVWYEVVLSAVMLTATVIFVAISISHMTVAWKLRKDLSVAVRSPRLGLLSGAVSTMVLAISLFRVMLSPAQAAQIVEGTVVEIITLPAVCACFTCAYGLRAFRLLIMYNPHMRKRWGTILGESAMVKLLLAIYIVMEVVAWSASLVFGVDRIADCAFAVSMSGALLTIGMCFTFVGSIRKIDDIFDLSLELQRVGAFALAFLLLGYPIRYLPFRFQRYNFILCLLLRYPSAVWFTNIQPTKALLRQKPWYNRSEGIIHSLFPTVPQKMVNKVAVLARESTLLSPRSSKLLASLPVGTDMTLMLSFPPLLEALQEFCQKALCSESLQFLVEANKFRTSLQESAGSHDGVFKDFAGIVDTYIKDNAAFEINVDYRTKKRFLAVAEEANFKETSSDTIAHILDDATKEIAKMLQDNLYHKFKATKQFQHINNMLFSAEARNLEPT
ncbi:unnamed protein product [Pylaiella littoralis]